MKKNKFYTEDINENSFKKKSDKFRTQSKRQEIRDYSLTVDSNGIPINIGDLVTAKLKTDKTVSNCEVIELRENGILTVMYDDPNGPITTFRISSKEVTIL